MSARTALLALFLSLGVAAHAQETCPKPGQVFMSLAEQIQKAGLSLEFDFNRTEWPAFNSPGHVKQNRDTVLANLEGKSQAERDALLLGRLSWSTQGTLPLLGVITLPDAGLFDAYLDVLDRHDLRDHAAALRTAQRAFPRWDVPVGERYNQWSDGSGGILNLALDATLRTQSQVFKSAHPPILTKAEEILREDPSYPEYLAKRDNADDYSKHVHLMAEIGACVPRYRTPAEADAALASIDPLLADFHVVDLFLLESGNGGMHQYLSNSTGMMAPQLLDVLTRWGLPDQAQALRDAIAYFPTPYPRDRPARNAVFNTFSETTHEALNAGTWISDDPEIWDAVQTRAQAAGFWPQ